MKILSFLAIAAMTMPLHAADSKPLTTDKEKQSYAVGLNVGSRFKSDVIDLDIDAFVRGFRDTINGTKPALTEEEVGAAMMAFQKAIQAKTAERGVRAEKDGADYLAKNKAKDGVKTTSSGLQYKVLTPGTGANPKATDTVKVHYRGTLIDGTEFDSSYKRNEPISFELGGVIKGWTEGLQLIKPGGKIQLVIPPDLGYGSGGQGPIPPNSVLLFDVELLAINPPEEK
jgi:FKBP-type peptidyl-prolyl cis-trans isomerase